MSLSIYYANLLEASAERNEMPDLSNEDLVKIAHLLRGGDNVTTEAAMTIAQYYSYGSKSLSREFIDSLQESVQEYDFCNLAPDAEDEDDLENDKAF